MGIEKAKKEIKKGKPREKIGKIIRKMKRKIERKRKNAKWSTIAGENKLKIATMNPDNIIDEGIIDEIIDKMEKYNIDITAIQETHDKKENDSKYRDHRIIRSPAKETIGKDGKKKLPEAGVAFIIKEEFAEEITRVTKFNERHIEIRIKEEIIISNTYAPHTGYKEEVKKEYWENINKNLYKAEDNKKMHIWLTDNNGQLGTKGKRDKNIGVNTRVKISSKGNGANLRKTLRERKMRAMNTFFQQESDPEKNREKLNTWRSINGKQRGQIDYMNIDTHKANWVQRVEFIGNANPKTENGHKAMLMTIENRRKKVK